MIFIVEDDTGEIRVFDGPNVNVAEVSFANKCSYRDELSRYGEANQIPSDEKTRQAWEANAPRQTTMEQWFLKNGYKEVEFVSLRS